MADATPATVIAALLEQWSGALVSKSRVVDGLLDLRNAVANRIDAVDAIDRALATMPGQTLVPREWAVEVLVEVDVLLGTTSLVP